MEMTDMLETDRKEHEVVDDANSKEVDEIKGHGSEPPSSTEKKSRRGWWIAGGVVVLIAAAAGIGLAMSGSNGSADAEEAVVANTAAVTQSNLIVTEELDGTLGYGTADPIVFRSSSDGVDTISVQASGTVTAVVEERTTIEFGDVLMEIDGNPVYILEGDIPAYRTFNSRTSDGADVQQLEQALFDLGYDPDEDMTIDEDMTSATVSAIELMQETLGYEETGSLSLGDVIFVTSPFYVAEVNVSVGDSVNPGTPVVATSSTIEGTVTSIATEGSILGQGDALFTVDGEPVALLIGDVPLYRSLAVGAEGADVEQLQVNLVALGFLSEDGNAAGTFDDTTFEALVDWQTSIGSTPDGVVNIGDVIFSADAIRVQENLVSVGDPVNNNTQIMTTSISETFVSVQLSTDDQDLVEVGDAVTVELPSGAEEPAIVTEIGSVVLATQQGATYFEMTVTLDNPEAAEGLDEAPVDVLVIGDRADDVTAVPVTALLALAEGGYAVEVVQADGTTALVGVSTGLFADGYVEVTGNVSEGMEVVIP